MQLIIKEISDRMDFDPFSTLHLICEIRCGILRLFEKIEYYFNDCNIVYHCDIPLMLDSFLKKENKHTTIKENIPTLLLYSNVLMDNDVYKQIMEIVHFATTDTMILDNKQKLIGYYFTNFNNHYHTEPPKSYNIISINNACVITYIWDMNELIGKQIENDFNLIQNFNTYHTKFISAFSLCSEGIYKQVWYDNNCSENIFVSNSAKISSGVVFDASAGKIIIDDEATIMPLSFIQGPCYIGKKTIVKAGATIYKDCCFGPFCKIGGELETTIFQGYSNKQHQGFIGHSFVSEWVNIGAGTSNSDLKNSYSNVIIHLQNKKIDTGKIFIGAMIGDHCKLAINTSLNTGTIIGICSNIAKAGLTDKYVSPFSWISDKSKEKYNLQKAILTAKVVMSRRRKELTFEEQQLITDCFMK